MMPESDAPARKRPVSSSLARRTQAIWTTRSVHYFRSLLAYGARRGIEPMPSPFPGMDPYLEAHWRDVHAALIIYARDALQTVLPAPLRARVEERVLL